MLGVKKVSKKIFLGGLVLVLGCFGMTGCAQESADPEPEPEKQEVVEEEEEKLPVIGKETDTALKIEATNATKKAIKGLSVKLSTDEAYPASLISGSEEIAKEETVEIFIEPIEAPQVEAEGEERGVTDVEMRSVYNIQLTFDDDSVVELHNVGLDNIVSIELCLNEDNVAYLEYETNEGAKESTLESELALIAEAEAAAQAQAEAEAAAQAQAEAEAAAQAEAAANESYNYDYGNDWGSSAGSGSQSEDTCVDDLILN